MKLCGNSDNSSKVMEEAFQNIMNEIIEHVIEGICFEAHRAVKLGYFPVKEYIIRENKFIDIPDVKGMVQPDSLDCDIFGNKKTVCAVFSSCPYCKQKKSADSLGRHVRTCRSKPADASLSWGIKENYENNIEEEDSNGVDDGNDNFDWKKGNDARKQASSAPNYDTMTQEEKQYFLIKHCGVISRRTGKPCGNSLSCKKHTEDNRKEVREFILGSGTDSLLDGDIDIDTVD